MIKLFRQIRQQLLSENKTGKYFKYAFGEIILVVIGILIALSINNWNENRKAKKALNQYLTVVKSNIESDLVVLDSVKAMRVEFKDFAKKELLTLVNNTYDFNTTMNATSSFSDFYFVPNTSGLEALKNSPYLGDINGQHIQQLITTYEQTLNDVAQREKSLNEYIENLEAQLSTKIDVSILYAFGIFNQEELASSGISELDLYNNLKLSRDFFEYKNTISQVALQDQVIIPRYNILKKVSMQVINEIDKFIGK